MYGELRVKASAAAYNKVKPLVEMMKTHRGYERGRSEGADFDVRTDGDYIVASAIGVTPARRF